MRSIDDEAGGYPLITLTAHLLISVDLLERKRQRKEREKDDQRPKRKDGNSVGDAWAQTEEPRNNTRHEEIGVQTTVENDQATKEKQRLKSGASARLMMLIMMELMRRSGRRRGSDQIVGRGGQVTQGNGSEGKKTREMETMTHVTIGPRTNANIKVHTNQIALFGNYRARIAYLSTLHRSIGSKEGKRECIVARERNNGRRQNAVTREWQRDRLFRMSSEKMAHKRGQSQPQEEERKMKNDGIKWAENERGGGGGSSGLQSLASSESEHTSSDETRKRTVEQIGGRGRRITEDINGSGREMFERDGGRGREIVQGMNGRGIVQGMNGRGRGIVQGMNGRGTGIVQGMNGRGRGMPEEINGRISRPIGKSHERILGKIEAERSEATNSIGRMKEQGNESNDGGQMAKGREEETSPAKGNNEGIWNEKPPPPARIVSSSASEQRHSSSSEAKKSSISSSSSSAASSSPSSASTSATVTSPNSTVASSESAKSSVSSSGPRQQKGSKSSASTAASSSTLRNSPAKTVSSIPTEISKNSGKSNSSNRRSSSGSSIPTERNLSVPIKGK